MSEQTQNVRPKKPLPYTVEELVKMDSKVLDLEEFIDSASGSIESLSRAFDEVTRERRKESEVLSLAAMAADMLCSDDAHLIVSRYEDAKVEYLNLRKHCEALEAENNDLRAALQKRRNTSK